MQKMSLPIPSNLGKLTEKTYFLDLMTGIMDIFMGFHGDIMYNQLVFHCSTDGKKKQAGPQNRNDRAGDRG
jgi:hypothetical protein